MTNSKKQMKTDTAMKAIVEANVVRVYQRKEKEVPNAWEQTIIAETQYCDRRWHVNDQGYVTFSASSE